MARQRDKKSARVSSSELPELASLHERHLGLTKAVSEMMAEAASVALSRHHSPPVMFEVTHEEATTDRSVRWKPPSERTRLAHANTDDATEAGAYSVALAAVEVELGLYAVSRTDRRTGADYYVGAPDADELDLEEAYRLEVSGVDAGDAVAVNQRLREKLKQTKQGQVDVPALACVVGFSAKRIALEGAEEDE